MMGIHEGQKELFAYTVDLERRVRSDHPLRRVLAAVDFTFARQLVAHCYGHNGHGGHNGVQDLPKLERLKGAKEAAPKYSGGQA